MVSIQLLEQSPQLRIVVATCKELSPSLSNNVLLPFCNSSAVSAARRAIPYAPIKPDTSGRITSTPINFSKARKTDSL